MSLLQCCCDCVDHHPTPPLSEFRSVKIKTKSCYLMRPFIPIISPKGFESFSLIEVKYSRALYLHNFRQRALKWWPRCTEWTHFPLLKNNWCRAVHGNVCQRSKCGIKIMECKLRLSTNSGCMPLWYRILWRFEVIQPHASSKRRKHVNLGCNCGPPASSVFPL